MSLTISNRTRIKITRQLMILGLITGLIYILLDDGFRDPSRFIVGGMSGIVLGLLMSYYELFLFKRGAKKIRFIWLLLIRGVIYLVSIVTIIGLLAALARMISWNMPLYEVIQSPRFYIGYIVDGDFSIAVAYGMFLTFSVNFVRMISRKMGQGVLISYITGTYYSPVHQARIVMFIRIKNAERILSKLGPVTYFQFLNEVFHDYSIPIIANRGIIYEYIEDLAVVTWSVDKGLANGNAIRTFVAIVEALKKKKLNYLEKYGISPEIRAGLHIGSVIRAEIGEVKTQLVLHGDTMNTTARVLNYAIDNDIEFVASSPLLHMIELPSNIEKIEIGAVALKGREEEVTLFELNYASDAK